MPYASASLNRTVFLGIRPKANLVSRGENMMNKQPRDISVDEIMQKIREEVERRKTASGAESFDDGGSPFPGDRGPFPMHAHDNDTRIWRLLKAIQRRLVSYSFYHSILGFARKFKQYIPRKSGTLLARNLLKYHDEDFVRNAYKMLLLREPDPDGMNTHLTKFRSGEISKVDILGRLRYSKEGRMKRVRVRWLLPRVMMSLAYAVPVIGYFLRFIAAVFMLPAIVKDVRDHEAAANARFTQYGKLLDANAERMENGLALKADIQTVEGLRSAVSAKAERLTAELNDAILDRIRRVHADLLGELHRQRAELEGKVTGLAPAFRSGVGEQACGSTYPDLDTLYLAFENQFRGTPEDIKERISFYLPYIEGVHAGTREAPVLDLGCGRGEWLALLKEKGYEARGVDSNRAMVQLCKAQLLDVMEDDLVEYLRAQKTGAFGAVTGFHIVEHLPLPALVELFDQSLRVLMPGGVAIFETPNPENLIVGACNFYIDPTHTKPIPPVLLKFVAEQRGFVDTKIIKIHKIKEPHYIGQTSIDEVLYLLSMEQDYSVLGRKA
jgi:SAM-dependent methyltransferase